MTKREIIATSSNYGKMTILIGLILAVPIIVLPFYPEEAQYFSAFFIPSIVTIIIGFLICLFGSKSNNRMFFSQSMKNNVYIVLYAWLLSIFVSAIPFVLGGQLTYIQALFEVVSGYSTSGLTVINFETTPHIYFFFRSFMQFVGIFGFTILIMMVILDKQSAGIFSSEGHADKLGGNLRKTARTLVIIYSFFAIIGIIGFIILGMEPFEAICQTFSTLSTGGYNTSANNFIDYDSVPIRIWSMVLMVIGSINVVVLLRILSGKIKKALQVTEVRFYFALIAIFTALNAFSFVKDYGYSLGQSILHGAYNIISSLSTTGNAIDTYNDASGIMLGSCILCMVLGGCVGSTSGGIKLRRIWIALQVWWQNLKQRMSPSTNVITMHYTTIYGQEEITDSLVKEAFSYIVMYFLCAIVGTFALQISEGCSFEFALFEFISCLSGAGLSVGITGPTTKAATLIIEMIGMFIGRLEIFIVFIGIRYVYDDCKKLIFKRR